MLVTGATGTLGRHVVRRLIERGHTTTAMSRRPDARVPDGARLVTGDILDQASTWAAVRDAEVVVHCASDPRGEASKTEVEGTRNLLDASAAAGVRHFIYISIVGVDRIPLKYYRAKLEAEELVEAATVPWTIQRATQFHELIAGALTTASEKLPVLPVPRGFRFQVLDSSECATRLADLAEGEPSRRVPDVGGPEVRAIEDLAIAFARSTDLGKRIVRLPIPGKTARRFRAGLNLAEDNPIGEITFEDFLAR